jgi:hypothetical protein
MSAAPGLKKALSQRQLRMIAIGGVIVDGGAELPELGHVYGIPHAVRPCCSQ